MRPVVLLLLAVLAAPLCGQVVLSSGAVQALPMVVTASRMDEPPDTAAATVHVLEGQALAALPALTLDGALRSVSDFSLFRRSDSLTANPTAQGVSLRGLGPSGASRSLVLLDGLPLNDPFGGWVAWTKVPREELWQAEIVPGGGATAWGNAALGGVIQVRTQGIGHPWPRPMLLVGDYGTRSAEFGFAPFATYDRFSLRARISSTNGYRLVAPERRGPIDVPAWSRHRWASGNWEHALRRGLKLAVNARAYEEFRGNGTPYTRNGTREKFLSARLAGDTLDTFHWDAVAYAQDQSFASTFSSVNATRTAETPASDQFAVPAVAFGAAWTGSWQHGAKAATNAGVDLRTVRGETRENFTFSAGNFTRQRIAGGSQAFAGLFALHQWALQPELLAKVGARVDIWRDTDGHRRETDRVTGALLRNDAYARQDDTEFSPSAGLVWLPEKSWRLRANAQHGFRRPTLNELYRPFRQGANVTEANPALRTERVTSAEVGAEWKLFKAARVENETHPGVIKLESFPPPTPFARLTLGVTAFWNDLRDAVGNVTIARGPGTFPIVGTLAAGGLGRQRLNLDRTRVQGLELSALWRLDYATSVKAEILLNDASVRRATVAPALVGKRVAQVPRRSAAVSVTWRANDKLTLTPRVRWSGRQFEDDENQLILGKVAVADLGAHYKLTRSVELFLTCENVGNARIETGRSADGIVNTGTPRLFVGGLRGNW